MEESVQCGECGNRFDSNVDAFCPRCGSVPRERDLGDAVGRAAVAGLRDPRVRRVRTAGVVLMVLGALAALQFAYLAVWPPEPDADLLDAVSSEPFLLAEPGGAMELHVHDGDAPVDATLAFRAPNGTLVSENATQDGWFNATLPFNFVNLTVTEGNRSQVHLLYADQGTRISLDVDLADAPEGAQWHAVSTVPFMRPLLGFLAFMALVVTAGGFAAWRVQALPLAVTGALLATLPGVLSLLVSVPAGLLLLAPGALALAFILGGRGQFQKP